MNVVSILMAVGACLLFLAAETAAGDGKYFYGSGFFLLAGFTVVLARVNKQLFIAAPFNWLAKEVRPKGEWIIYALTAALFATGLYYFLFWMFNEPIRS
jgi:hypothetical protein